MPDHAKLLAAEVDALRARLAEVEAERDGFRNGQGQVQAMLDDLYKSNDRLGTKLAASQAEARALREALEKFKWAASPEQHGGTSAYPYEDICALLATPPGSDAALREVVMRAVCAGEEWASDSSAYHGCTTAKEAVQIRKDIVDAILGPNATDANEGGGE